MRFTSFVTSLHAGVWGPSEEPLGRSYLSPTRGVSWMASQAQALQDLLCEAYCFVYLLQGILAFSKAMKVSSCFLLGFLVCNFDIEVYDSSQVS